MTNGHRKKDEEKEEAAEGQRGPVSTAIAQAQQQAQESVTTSEEREKVDAFRNQIKEEKSDESFYEEVRKDYYANPDAKGLADVK